MNSIAYRGKAVAMLSGGLDSSLALALVVRQEIDVIGVNFSTGFCMTDHQRMIQRKDADPKKLRNEALRAGADMRVPVEIIDISEEYMEILRKPRFGYGKNINPCLDCRIFMLQKAKSFMEEIGADFVFTGEVLGQRPKSQHRRAMRIIDEECGLGDRLVRPLSAKLLAPTWPESQGMLDRDQLKGFHGRDRNPQFDLAEELGVLDYPQPAGGCCYLTDANYAKRVFDLLNDRDRSEVEREDLVLCKVGRHFRLPGGARLIVGRFEEENIFLDRFVHRHARMVTVGHKGATALVDLREGQLPSVRDLEIAAGVLARYGKGRDEAQVCVRLRAPDVERDLTVAPLPPKACEAWILR
jgi:tRNA-uridine 2-sulfurtransferase